MITLCFQGRSSISIADKEKYDIHELTRIMSLLRSPKGCPWDREQTHLSIRENFIEEAYEAVEAIDTNNVSLLKEELGDVLLQVVFHTQIEEEAGNFTFGDVCDGICRKLIRRHPHIFGDVKADGNAEVLRNWEDIKKSEKNHETFTQTLKNIPPSLPALMRAEKVQKRAARSGFDYPGLEWAKKDLSNELVELDAAIESGNTQSAMEELGDVLFSVINVARFLDINAEESLTKSTNKFISRFEKVEGLAVERGINMEQADLQVLDSLWKEAKNKD